MYSNHNISVITDTGDTHCYQVYCTYIYIYNFYLAYINKLILLMNNINFNILYTFVPITSYNNYIKLNNSTDKNNVLEELFNIYTV